MATQHWITMEN